MGGNSKKKAKKKGHGAEKTAAKTERKAARRAKKDARTAGEADVDAVVAQLEAEESAKCRPLVELEPDAADGNFRPSPRSGFTWTANPRAQEVYLFGGEQRLPGSGRLRVLNEHLVYRPAGNRWVRLGGGGTLPTPRSSHQAALAKPTGQPAQLFVFGGEFATPTESQFHHYGDLWAWTVKSRQWRRLAPAGGGGPCPRSGHRMVALRRPHLRLFVFGGFQDNGRAFRYLNDLWAFDFELGEWTEVRTAGPLPAPRSACLLFPLPDDSGLCVVGGYARRTEKRTERGIVHTDCFTLSAKQPSEVQQQPQAQSQAPTWQPMKFSGQRPTPRCGVSGAVNPSTGRAYAFGGVFDIEQADDGLTGVMFNELYQLDLAKQRWRLLEFAPPGESAVVAASAATSAAAAAAAAAPCERINAGLAVLDDLLYLYGGIFEGEDEADVEGDGGGCERSRTLDDLHCLNLKRLDAGWTTLLPPSDLGAEYLDDPDDGDDDEDDDDNSGSTSEGDGDCGGDNGADTEAAPAPAPAAVEATAAPAADEESESGPPPVAPGESPDAYTKRTGGYWSKAVGDSLKRCWSPEDVTPALVGKYARRAAKDFYWQTADS